MSSIENPLDYFRGPRLGRDGGFELTSGSQADPLPVVTSISHLIDILANLVDSREMWYRGHARSDYKLLPSLLRGSWTVDSTTCAESTALTADSIQLPYYVYDDPIALMPLIRDISSQISLSDLSLMESFFLAQHYGIPTPFLDWSSDPLVAAWFALDGWWTRHEAENSRGASGADPQTDPQDLPALWITDPTFLIKVTYPITIPSEYHGRPGIPADALEEYVVKVMQPDNFRNGPIAEIPIPLVAERDFSPRIVRQGGKFTFGIVQNWPNGLATGSAYVSRNPPTVAFLGLVFDPSKVPAMLHELEVLGVKESSVYGDRTYDPEVEAAIARLRSAGRIPLLRTDGRRRG